jgi:hypothetical protein
MLEALQSKSEVTKGSKAQQYVQRRKKNLRALI